jgi:hypothetical protein
MKLFRHIALFVLWTLGALAMVAVGVYQLTAGNVYWSIAATVLTGILLAELVNVVFNFGIFVGKRQAEREAEDEDDGETSFTFPKDMPKGLQMAIMSEMRKAGLRPVSMHKVGADDDDEDANEEQIIMRLKAVSEEITDPDMKEFAFHFTHIATDCPGSLAHATRMHEVVAHIEARLRASTVAAQNDDDRPTLH